MSISTIKRRYYSLAKRLGAPKKYVRFATVPQHDGSPHIAMNGTGYSYVVTERGSEYERRTSTDIDDILYWLVSDLTWGMASDDELLHRKDASDSRRILFQKHLELLATVNRDWSRRKQLEYEAILRNHPYADDQGEQSPLPKPSSTEGLSPPDQ